MIGKTIRTHVFIATNIAVAENINAQEQQLQITVAIEEISYYEYIRSSDYLLSGISILYYKNKSCSCNQNNEINFTSTHTIIFSIIVTCYITQHLIDNEYGLLHWCSCQQYQPLVMFHCLRRNICSNSGSYINMISYKQYARVPA